MKLDALYMLAGAMEPHEFAQVILARCASVMRPKLDRHCNLNRILGADGPLIGQHPSHGTINTVWVYSDGQELGFSPRDSAWGEPRMIERPDRNIRPDCPFTVISYNIFFPNLGRHWDTIPYKHNAYCLTFGEDGNSHWAKANVGMLGVSFLAGYYTFYSAITDRVVGIRDFLAYP